MADQINEYGANISPRSVRRLLNTEGLNARRSRKKRKITSTMAKKRLEWVKGLDHWTTDYWEKTNGKRAAKCACGLTPGMHCAQNDAICSEIVVVCCCLCLFKMFKTIERPADCEIRSVIRFLTARNVSAADILRQINEVYGPNAMSDSKVRK
ncbi:hypothetical protein J6590_004918 [Homalodisca vitripennis]|nr:hypothetical protein J6590_004918 [Homalodisca vitripennis]